MVGTAVGAGIFGLPYVFVRSGYGLGVCYVIVLGAILMLVNLAYGEVVLATKDSHQFPVYVEKYLGKRWKYLAIASMFIGFYGALAAYLLEVSHLLTALLQPFLGGTELIYLFCYTIVIASTLYIGLRAVSNLEKILMIAMLSLVSILVIAGWPYLHVNNYVIVSGSSFFLPYGVVLFALSAASAVPDMKNILVKRLSKLKTAIIIGSCIPIVVYIAFTAIVVGITGASTTESSLVGLGQALGKPILIFGSIFGIITMSTSFLMLGLVLKEVYMYDFKWPPLAAWVSVMIPPLLIVLLNWLSFIEILGISGALIGGLDGIMIMKMHRQIHANQDRHSEFTITQSRLVHAFSYIVFIGGITYEVYAVAQRLL